jgi:hypothetical protein
VCRLRFPKWINNKSDLISFVKKKTKTNSLSAALSAREKNSTENHTSEG